MDLIFTNEESMVNDVKYLPGLGSSDHICLQFELACYCDHVEPPRPRYNVYKADFSKMQSLLEAVNWEESQEKRRVNMDPFLHCIYTIGLYTV